MAKDLSKALETLLRDHPLDDDAKRVFADQAIDAGDPRGELINLQFQRLTGTLSKAQRAREKAVLAKHGRTLAGPLADVCAKSLRFEKGFLSACTITKDANHLAGDPLWATVERLDAGKYATADYAKVYRHPVMKSLRSVVVDGGDRLGQLCTGKHRLTVERLVVNWLRTPAEATALGLSTALPKLAQLELDASVAEACAVLRGPVAARLEHFKLELPPSRPSLGALHALADERMPGALTVVDRQNLSTEYVFQRSAAGRLSRLNVTFDCPEKKRKHLGAWTSAEWPNAILDNLEAGLGSLKKESIDELVLRARPGVKAPALRRRVVAMTKRFKCPITLPY